MQKYVDCNYPVWGEKEESKVTLSPFKILSWRSIVVHSWLSVFHFSVKVSPCSLNLYLVSKLPETFPVSVLDEPPEVNSTPETTKSVPVSNG